MGPSAVTVLTHNADIAAAFDEMADLLELSNENPFRARAYRNAARIVAELGLDIGQLVARGEEIPKIAGIGEDLAGKMAEIARTGSCRLLEQLRGRFPRGITELLRLPGLGPKKVGALNAQLHIGSLRELRRAAAAGKLHELRGFGERTEHRLLEAVDAELNKARRFKLAAAAQYAEPLARYLGAFVAGSYRRMKETVGDLDFLASSGQPEKLLARFVAYPEVARVLAKGPTKAMVVLKCGIQCDLRVVAPESFGAALHYFTGSKAHNIAIRKLGVAHGLKINEYGVFRGRKRIAGDTEESVYAAVGLPYITPELREDQGEIEAAMRGTLPRLVSLEDLAGDLHVHTSATDGRASLDDMVLAARAAGLRYIAVTDHSRRVAMAHGLDPQRLARQGAEIDAVNATWRGIRVLKGVEVDILEDGSLDLPGKSLAALDIVVAAVHGRFDLPRARQTERILAAMDDPHVAILAHPTGRLLEERAAYDVDMLAIVRKARARGIALELNAHPDRLDLDDVHCRMAKDEGVLVAIGSDSHATNGFAALRYGVGQARRGWLARADILNTRPAAEVMSWLASRRALALVH
ncbi:MAG TPA: DNA polymerase/3'-5' exonuclease PolX [Usitatibacter sp.]|nr:DNA polymerase/3'-5' exonuclease PolX [Usitatibacter sp.]